jgi:hypothetical protein
LQDRTAWMIGATKDDMAYFASVSEKQGHFILSFYQNISNVTFLFFG